MWPQALSFGDQGFGDEILFIGAPLTIQLALASLALGLLLGLTNASMGLSRYGLLRGTAELYTTVVRGIPEFLVVLVIFFGSNELLLFVAADLFGYQGEVEMSRFLAGTLALGLIFGAYAGEVFRGAFLAVPAGQVEAALACGMTRTQIFFRVRMPQMWRYAIPGLGNLWMVLLKDTSLVSVIALDETLRWSKVAAESTGLPFSVYLFAAAIYLTLTILSDAGRSRLESWSNRGVQQA